MKLLVVVSVLLCVAAAIISAEDVQKMSDGDVHARDILLDKLFTNYKKHNHPDKVKIKFGIAMLNVDFDVENHLMISDVWVRMVWTDSRLQWDNKTNGIEVLRIPSDMVWRPDIMIYSGKQIKTQCADINALVYPNGEVLQVPPCQIQSYCNLTLGTDPYKEQNCTLKFGSWTFDGLIMDMQLYNNKTFADLSDYIGRKYTITKNEGKRNEKYYDCCKEPYLDITYTLGITRVPEKSEDVCDKQ